MKRVDSCSTEEGFGTVLDVSKESSGCQLYVYDGVPPVALPLRLNGSFQSSILSAPAFAIGFASGRIEISSYPSHPYVSVILNPTL